MPHDRAQTEQRLIDAVGQIIAENGFDQLGINRIASRSGVNKILIYRYFGGLNGLLDVYYEHSRHVVSAPTVDVDRLKTASLEEFFDVCYERLIREYRLLRQNPEAKEFLMASLTSSTGLTNPAAAEKEDEFQQMVDELSSIIKTESGRPFAAIMVSAMSLLTFMSQQKRTFLGIDLSTDEGWSEVERALKNIYRGAFLYTQERLNTPGEESA